MGSLGISVLAAALICQTGAVVDSEEGPDTQGVRAVLDKYATACERKDFASLSAVFSRDADITMISTYIPQRYVGFKSVTAQYKALCSSTDTLKVRHDNVAIKLLAAGNAACLACDQDAIGTISGEPFRLQGVRMTWVLEKQEGQWRVVHAHWSLPAEFEPEGK